MSLWHRILSLLGADTEPQWKQHPEFYYVCPDCGQVVVNATWRMRHRAVGPYKREVQLQCPSCGEWVPLDDVETMESMET